MFNAAKTESVLKDTKACLAGFVYKIPLRQV